MISATNLKNGITFKFEGKPYRVVKYEHQKIGRGGATVKLVVRNLINGNLESKTFNSTSKFEEINTFKKPLQFLYSDKNFAVFMDEKNYEQIEVPVSNIENELKYITQGSVCDVLFWDDKVLSVDIAPKIVLKVVDTTPGIKGNTTSNVYKPAKLENGLDVKVPLFVKKGDRVRVDTRTGEYVERVN